VLGNTFGEVFGSKGDATVEGSKLLASNATVDAFDHMTAEVCQLIVTAFLAELDMNGHR
jgi:hypothetical protein